ncbi:DUF2627 domain-containing protein [Paenibacillus shirakamiensis]|nr:DUF2627 domain-containing protein [Paenibacillus shirakamiensis]
MKTLTARFIAVLILVIPGIIAMIGFIFMKDAIFFYMSDHGNDNLTHVTFDWMRFVGGLVMFAIGMSFLGGWIYFRDHKRNYTGPRSKNKPSTKQLDV